MAAHVMIHILPDDLPKEGLKVLYRCGEHFEGKIEWGEITDGLLVPAKSCNSQGEPGLKIADLDSDGYAGFEARTGNYWRYLQDTDPEVFREKCMQIIEINQEFTPKSSWRSWRPRIDLVTDNMLRLNLKNQVTGAELSYKIIDKGFGYQIKDLSKGRRIQKLLKHDYILNQLLKTSYKHLDYHAINIETQEHPGEDGVGGFIVLDFHKDKYRLTYQLDDYEFVLKLYDNERGKDVKTISMPHSNVIEDTRTFFS